VAVDFDGDADLIRASLATCHHQPQWQVQGNQIRAVFTAEAIMPAPELEIWIWERAADAAVHLADARREVERHHEELHALLQDVVPTMMAVRLAGQLQREELSLRFAEPDKEQAAAPHTAISPDTEADARFRQVLDVLESSASVLPANTPLVNALPTEDLLRSLLVLFLGAKLPEPYLFIPEEFHGQGKVDIAVHWNHRLIGIIECKVWHSEPKFRDGIDQALSYLTAVDTRAAYVVFIRRQEVTPIVTTLKKAMLDHAN
jgi:hypothetical protein